MVNGSKQANADLFSNPDWGKLSLNILFVFLKVISSFKSNLSMPKRKSGETLSWYDNRKQIAQNHSNCLRRLQQEYTSIRMNTTTPTTDLSQQRNNGVEGYSQYATIQRNSEIFKTLNENEDNESNNDLESKILNQDFTNETVNETANVNLNDKN